MVYVEGVICLALAASRWYSDMLLVGTSMHMCIAGYTCVDLCSSASDNHLTASAHAVKIKRMQPDMAHQPAMNQFQFAMHLEQLHARGEIG